jgi:3-oxoacyl-[acyl-carrier protein] reductase
MAHKVPYESVTPHVSYSRFKAFLTYSHLDVRSKLKQVHLNIFNMSLLRLREQDLAGKIAVITGASRGIGRATAFTLASRGCSILGTCSSPGNLNLFDKIDQEIEALFTEAHQIRNSKIVGIEANILSPTCAQTIANALVQHFTGRVDIFINNAADSGTGELGELAVEEIQRSLISNIQTPVLIVDELVNRKLFQQESRIIYISSVRSRQPWSQQLMYEAGKSAGESLCRTWSQAFGGREEKVSTCRYFDIQTLKEFIQYIIALSFVPID